MDTVPLVPGLHDGRKDGNIIPEWAVGGRWREVKCTWGSGEGSGSSGRDSEKLLGKRVSGMDQVKKRGKKVSHSKL